MHTARTVKMQMQSQRGAHAEGWVWVECRLRRRIQCQMGTSAQCRIAAVAGPTRNPTGQRDLGFGLPVRTLLPKQAQATGYSSSLPRGKPCKQDTPTLSPVGSCLAPAHSAAALPPGR